MTQSVVPLGRCAWADCHLRAAHQASEWGFCARHLAEHRSMVVNDTYVKQVCVGERRFEQQVRSACRGQLLPSGSLRAVLDVLLHDIHAEAS